MVRDASGAVLPGVTVEASSPVLIEQLRSVVTDGEGRYNIVDLRPGTEGPYLLLLFLDGGASASSFSCALAALRICHIA